jgi:hypothetical protein
MSSSLLLDTDAWDICLDAQGHWALASDPYAIVQNVSCACLLFQGEAWFDTTKGVPYWNDVFGPAYPIALIRADIEAAAEAVDGVDSASLAITSITSRALTGQVQVQTAWGALYASI